MKLRSSLSLRLAAVAMAGCAVTAAIAAAAAALWSRPAPVLVASLLGGGLFTAWAMSAATRPLRRALSALTDGVRGFRASDFSLRLGAKGQEDEIGELLGLFNEIADVMRAERRELYQRELLLDTLLQSAPIATILAASSGRVVFSNRTARELLGGGRRLEGQRFQEILDACPPAMREGLSAAEDVLFTTPGEHGDETYRAARRTFQMNAQIHTLYTVERLTPELRRREVEVWKNAIRVINHELNNSFAPIRSLVHTGRSVLDRPEHAETLREIFQTVEERVTHLAAFLDGYAQIARVPRPRRQEMSWADFVEQVRRVSPFRLDGEVPRTTGCFDPALLQQMLLNLLKNAHESGSPPEEVAVTLQSSLDGGVVLRVLDRGPGMDSEALRRAPLPFYTSKPGGTGLGVPLSSEIAEAHGGRLQLENRPGGGLIVTCRIPGSGPAGSRP